MPHAGLSAAVSRAGRAALRSADEPPSDGRLLAAFVATRDPDAFAELVARHGPMVFAVCRRLTGHTQDAEDAFQAVFVVLARKAAAVSPREAVGNWLYGVAVRTAREARCVSARRRTREVLTDPLPDVARASPEPDDLGAVLHEELAELCDKFRSLLVLCDLEGRPQSEVAARLGLPVGTVYSRLATARRLLAARLRKRGVGLSAAAITAALAQAGRAAVPAGLSAKAVAAAASPGLVPASVAALSHGVAQRMFLTKLKALVPVVGLVALGLLTCGLMAAPDPLGSGSPLPRAVAATPGRAPQAPKTKPAAAPVPVSPNKILFDRAGRRLAIIDPDGKNETKVSEDPDTHYHTQGVLLSPDGKTIAALVLDPLPPDTPPGLNYATATLHVRRLTEKEPGTSLGIRCQSLAWSPDGTEIVYSDFMDGPNRKTEAAHGIVNVKTMEKAALRLPAGHLVTDWSRDGKYFLTTSALGTPGKPPTVRLHLMHRDGTEHKALTDGKPPAGGGRISPDGRRVLFTELNFSPDAPRPAFTLQLLDVASGKATKVEDVPLNAEVQGYCWSPDGRKIAYAWREILAGKPEEVANNERECFLVVCDPDGKNAKTIATEKAGNGVVAIGNLDWR